MATPKRAKAPVVATPATTQARLRSAAQQTGYTVTGCGGIDIVSPAHATAIYQLSRGAVVVAIHGIDSRIWWRETYAQAEKLFWSVREMVRTSPDLTRDVG